MSPDLRDRERLMTPGEVARWLRVDPKTVSRWAADGRVSSIRTPGGQHRFRRSDLLAAIEAGGQR